MHRNTFYFLNKTYVMVMGTLNKHLNEAALKLNKTSVHHTRDILVKTTWMSLLVLSVLLLFISNLSVMWGRFHVYQG